MSPTSAVTDPLPAADPASPASRFLTATCPRKERVGMKLSVKRPYDRFWGLDSSGSWGVRTRITVRDPTESVLHGTDTVDQPCRRLSQRLSACAAAMICSTTDDLASA